MSNYHSAISTIFLLRCLSLLVNTYTRTRIIVYIYIYIYIILNNEHVVETSAANDVTPVSRYWSVRVRAGAAVVDRARTLIAKRHGPPAIV